MAHASGGGGGGGRAARALRLLFLVVLALAAVEYLSGSILDASPLRTYLYTPAYNTTQPSLRNPERLTYYWPKRVNATESQPSTPRSSRNQTRHNSTINTLNSTISSPSVNTTQNVLEVSSPSRLLQRLLNITAQMTESGDKVVTTQLPLCDEMPPDLGPVPVNKSDMTLEAVELKYPEVRSGGWYAPPNCTARHKVAIVVPFRDRQQHLAIFLNHMHPFLMKQQVEYGIFIVEQDGNQDFNRAKLMNVGFAEAQRLSKNGWRCFVFHDIDLLPLDARNLYSCPRQPRHMSASIDKLNFKLPYQDIFGGVSALTVEQFKKVNGFSNKYWGWGGEDDDMFYRVKKSGYHVSRYKMSIARYAMLDHKKSSPNPKRYQLLSQTSKTFQKDGLSSLEYELVKITNHHLYTHILVNIDERS